MAGIDSSGHERVAVKGWSAAASESQQFSPIDCMSSALLRRLHLYVDPCPHPSSPTTCLPLRRASAPRKSKSSTAAEGGKLYIYHFNMLRSILKKTATLFWNDDFSTCIHGVDDAELYARALNLLSHGKYDIYQPAEIVDDNKQLFRQILRAFLGRYKFALPDIFERPATKAISTQAA